MHSRILLLAAAAAFTGNAGYAEIACVWTQKCDQSGVCETVGSPEDEPGFFIVRDRDFDALYRFEQDTGAFVVSDTQPEADAQIYDVTYISKENGSVAFFGQKHNRVEMLSIGTDGTAAKSTHYLDQPAAFHTLGICTGEY